MRMIGDHPLNQRSTEILKAVVQGFIETGEPVSSEWLYERYDFGIRPAMIRLELNDLTERGYLEQPHHAAGRMPSDAGYELFANQMLAAAGCGRDSEIAELFEQQAWPELLGHISESLGVLGVAATSREHNVFKGPLENLVDNLDWSSREEIKALIRDFEELDERMDRAWQALAGEPFKVFVGKKSPITRSGFLSVVAGEYDTGGQHIILCAIGPKHMDYSKTAKLMKGLGDRKPRTAPTTRTAKRTKKEPIT